MLPCVGVCLLGLLMPATGGASTCKKVYTPSPLETKWVTNIEDWQSDDKQWEKGCHMWRKDLDSWWTWMDSLNARGRSAAPLTPDIFSFLNVECAQREGHTKVYLEPLAAALRHPFFFCNRTDEIVNVYSPRFVPYLFDLRFIALPVASEVKARRTFLFDAGSGVSFDGSLSWFAENYQAQGFNFTRMFAWEVQHANRDTYWDSVPEQLRHRLHFYNVPISSEKGHPMHLWEFIQKRTREEDYVVVKLDIDNNSVETDLVLQLAENPELYSLIDEIYWENHVTLHPLSLMWAMPSSYRGQIATMHQSFQMFSRLRHLGIRAHSWV